MSDNGFAILMPLFNYYQVPIIYRCIYSLLVIELKQRGRAHNRWARTHRMRHAIDHDAPKRQCANQSLCGRGHARDDILFVGRGEEGN